jgi:outer membrane protein OmpA-like peptidoglycan-associated protein/flagellar hook assembly protein FlgD
VVRSYSWTGSEIPAVLVWDGKDDSGADAPEGLYYYFVGSTDTAGNRASATVQEITLTRQYEVADIRLSQDIFSFNHDKEIRLFLRLSGTAGLVSWKVEVKNSKNKTLRTIDGEKTLPPFIVWDCRDDQGNALPDGEYRITFATSFKSGNTPSSYDKKLIVDSTPPETSVSHRPDYFSPDGDGEHDLLYIRPVARDNFEIASWAVRVYAPSGAVFKEFTGQGALPEQIIWDGIGEGRDIVESAADYFIEVEASDRAGNVSRSPKDRVLVDILVIVTERGLKMRISNIEFAFGSAQITKKGTAILDRVAVILNKYANYDVIIEGHTDDIGEESYNLRLSETRAKSVLNYLLGKGLSPERLQHIGMGETVALYPNTSDENRRRNRRVEFLLIKKGE